MDYSEALFRAKHLFTMVSFQLMLSVFLIFFFKTSHGSLARTVS